MRSKERCGASDYIDHLNHILWALRLQKLVIRES